MMSSIASGQRCGNFRDWKIMSPHLGQSELTYYTGHVHIFSNSIYRNRKMFAVFAGCALGRQSDRAFGDSKSF